MGTEKPISSLLLHTNRGKMIMNITIKGIYEFCYMTNGIHEMENYLRNGIFVDARTPKAIISFVMGSLI